MNEYVNRKDLRDELYDADAITILWREDGRMGDRMKAKSYRLKYTPTEEQLIKELSAIDSVKVVRCKDCKYHHWEQEPCHGKIEHYCELPHMRGIEVFEEFFCYYGKQKEYDNNG